MKLRKKGAYDNYMKAQKTSLFAETMQRVWENPGARVGVILLAIICLACIFAPVIAPYGVNEMDLQNMFKGPIRLTAQESTPIYSLWVCFS